MKTQQWVSRKAALMLCIVTALIGCSDGGGGSSSPPPPPPPQIQREFTDLTLVRGKSITLIDETGGTTDLKARGIWQKFNETFKKVILSPTGETTFDGIYTNGGEITITVVNSSSDYEVINHNIKLSLTFVNSTYGTVSSTHGTELVEYICYFIDYKVSS
jgi:hypothetical protein